MTTNREAALQLIMRQCAIFNGVNLEKVTPQIRARYRTLAENVLATVERKQTSYNWNSPLLKVHTNECAIHYGKACDCAGWSSARKSG